MPLLTPSGQQFSLQKLMAMSTMLSPTHGSHRPLIQAGGGDATSEIPARQLYFCHAIQQHLRRVYDGIRGPEPFLSRQRFERWLFAIQHQTINSFDKEEYKFEEFLETAYYNRVFEALREIIPEQKDLTKSISNYYISSSHNTYLSGNQLSSRASTEAYKNVSTRLSATPVCMLIGCRYSFADAVALRSTYTMGKTPQITNPRITLAQVPLTRRNPQNIKGIFREVLCPAELLQLWKR